MAAKRGQHDGPEYHKDFILSITKALGDQLASALAGLGRAPLRRESLLELKDAPGVYQLYRGDDFVYVGKAESSLPKRLGKHLQKISGRKGIGLDEMSFSCLYVAEDFSALAPERLLINHYKGMDGIPWNHNGFGNNDPGKQRDTTVLKANHFDMCFPIDLELTVEGLTAGTLPLTEFLKKVKAGLRYNFRYEPPRGFGDEQLTVPDAGVTADEALRMVSAKLPEDWQISALMGYVIMYSDQKRDYPAAWRYYRGDDQVEVTPKADLPGLIEPDNTWSDTED